MIRCDVKVMVRLLLLALIVTRPYYYSTAFVTIQKAAVVPIRRNSADGNRIIDQCRNRDDLGILYSLLNTSSLYSNVIKSHEYHVLLAPVDGAFRRYFNQSIVSFRWNNQSEMDVDQFLGVHILRGENATISDVLLKNEKGTYFSCSDGTLYIIGEVLTSAIDKWPTLSGFSEKDQQQFPTNRPAAEQINSLHVGPGPTRRLSHSMMKPRSSFFEVITFLLRMFSNKRGSVIDGSFAGDYGVDFFGVCNTEARLDRMREIELKHARIAMLAAVGWPAAELFHPVLIDVFKLTPQLALGGQAPTVLNGGLLRGSNAIGLGLFTALFSGLEYMVFTNRNNLRERYVQEMNSSSIKRLNVSEAAAKYGLTLLTRATNQSKTRRRRRSTYVDGREPGDFGFDPLNLYEVNGASPQAKKEMRRIEIDNGRLAMFVITTYVMLEASTGKSVVELTPAFFKPMWSSI